MIIDTHAHLNFKDYDNDREEVIKKCLQEGVFVINVGTCYQTSKKAVEIAENHEKGVYASVGLHPIYKEKYKKEDYEELLNSKKVVAIGEIGLDKKYPHKEQLSVFEKQLDFAKDYDLPVIIHCRMAHKEVRQKITNHRGVIHSFTGNKKDARDYVEKGFYLGFNGIIFKTTLDSTIKETPLERILLETDCPYLTPPLEEGRNFPYHVKYIAQKIAEVKNISTEEVIKTTFDNAVKLFKIDKR